MANERGSIKISTANEIGTALVTKLGGSGYAPNDWDKMIKLLGIARQDANPALSVLSDSSGIGSERGSILISKANSIGAMLNKKYYTSEGFAPKKWASAISKLKALTTNTASGSIIAIADGADDMDLLNYEATIPARLDPVSSIHGKRTGKNLVIEQPAYTESSITLCFDMGSNISVNHVTLSFKATDALALRGDGAVVDYREEDGTHHYRSLTGFKDSNGNYYQPNVVQNGYFSNTYSNISFRYIYIYYTQTSYNRFQTDCISDWQVELGNVRTDYEAPVTPVAYEASLGRSIYGGSANLITGEGKVNVNRVQIKDLSWTYYTSGTNPIFYAGNIPDMKTYARGEMPNIAVNGYTKRTAHSRSNLSSNMADMECSAIENVATITFRNDSYTSIEAMLEAIGDEYIVYETTTEESFTFDPITIKTMEGNNDFWVNEGTSEIEYYQKPTAYTRATLTGAIVKVDNARIDLPFTKAKITIEPTVLGKSSAVLNRGGKNFLNPSVVFSAPAIYNYNNNGSVTVLKSDDRAWSNMPSLSIKAGTYVINNPNGRIQYVLASESYQTVHGITSASGTITIASNDSIKIKMGLGASYPFTDYYQLELGTTPTTYEKYVAPSKITSDLGSTVYGASVDLAKGECIKTWDRVLYKGADSENWNVSQSSGVYRYYITNNSAKLPSSGRGVVYSSIGEYSASGNEVGTIFTSAYNENTRIFYIPPQDCTTVELFKTWLQSNNLDVVFEKATPATLNITPKIITCRNGMINFWSGGSGNTEIEYFVAE